MGIDHHLLIDGTLKSNESTVNFLSDFSRKARATCEFDETRVHDDYSVIGSEFCDFLSTVLTFRLIKRFDSAKRMYSLTDWESSTQTKQQNAMAIRHHPLSKGATSHVVHIKHA
ncbi:MAG: hypothetical protein LBL49_02555 [Clostridiales Family XIII bacterium]|jgi:hypothetical protein|nr:hypothetical protein [Clostridiales Family XIII bacterium]